MEQVEFNKIQDIKFSNYFFDIENLRQEDLSNINLLIKKYPYCQALHLLAARSAVNSQFYEKTLANAAVSVPSRNILYNFIHHPEKFKGREPKKVVQKETPKSETLISIIDDDTPVSDRVNSQATLQEEKYSHNEENFDEIAMAIPDETTVSIHNQPVFENVEIENLSLDGEKYSETLITDEVFEESKEQTDHYQEEIAKETVATEDFVAENIDEDVLEEEPSEVQPSNEDEELESLNQESVSAAAAAAEEEEEEEEIEKIRDTENENIEEDNSETTGNATFPYIENIEDDDEDKEQEEQVFTNSEEIEKEAEKVSVVSSSENFPSVQEPINLSRYNDERLPYTFLWWLSKTRKTYQENLRPYATFSLDTTQEIKKSEDHTLEHQIAENIFHINSVSEIENKIEGTSTVAFDFMRKEHQIIEKFIKEEPQIKPPPANKIDTENKAKRSSEDSNELVSETLAKVYVEQMLFHKALDVYRKLSLKYPEKSAYFASQIKYLELKVN